MTHRVTIRPAGSADAPRLAVLCQQLWYPTSPEVVERRLQHLRQDDRHAVYVAELTEGSTEIPFGQVVGWVHVYLSPSLLDDLHAEIGGLVVDESCRGQRIGERLLQQAEQWARERGCQAISVRSNTLRHDAHRFYQRLGYQVTKTQLALRRPL
jgi:GNAT superfamily N-acetyltransferase